MQRYILALDQGTTSSRAILFGRDGSVAGYAQQTFRQHYPQPGWVEHDPNEIWESERAVAAQALRKAGLGREIAAIGITNQRETTILWDRATGEPIYNAIVWQCRRTADIADALREKRGVSELVAEKTGLQIDAYFSATKIRWLLDHVPGAQERAARGELLFGTVETWLIWKLTGGKVHVTDYSNASRTMLFNIHTLSWDEELCALLDIPMDILPRPVSNSEVYGTVAEGIEGLEALAGVPICGAAGDQQAALFGQGCFTRGQAKNTYGTGCFTLMNIVDTPVRSRAGLVTTVGWNIGGETTYAIEGSVFNAGSAIQWLRDELKIIESAPDSEYYAGKVKDTNGCYVVPAFTGLGAPHWDQYARGTIVGITRGVNKNHIIRATMESLAYQVNDILVAMQADSGIKLAALNVDGGASANNLLMQMQSDISGAPVQRPTCVETTAMGAAYLAGLAVGYWASKEDVVRNRAIDRVFHPEITAEERAAKVKGWSKAVKCSYGWAKDE